MNPGEGDHNTIPDEPPRRHPVWKRALEHALQTAVGGYSLTVGSFLMLRAAAGAELPSSLTGLPMFLVYALAGFVAFGGALTLYGTYSSPNDVRKQLNNEQMGWLLLGFGWAAYIVSALSYAQGAALLMSVAPWFAAGSLGRFIWLVLVEKALDAVVPEEGDEWERE